jgi:hypothetical protein
MGLTTVYGPKLADEEIVGILKKVYDNAGIN